MTGGAWILVGRFVFLIAAGNLSAYYDRKYWREHNDCTTADRREARGTGQDGEGTA